MKTNQMLMAVLAGATALLAACSDSTGSTATGPGSLSFGYSGARSGTYSANGEFKANTTSFAKQPFAVGARSTTRGSAVVMLSYAPVTSSTGDMVIFGLPNVSGTGDFDLSENGCTGVDLSTCPFGLLLFNTNPDLEEDNAQVFAFSSGTVHVTSNSGGHLRGTFTGTAETFLGDSVITITNGAFDVPVRSESSLSLNRAATRSTRMLERHAKPEEY